MITVPISISLSTRRFCEDTTPPIIFVQTSHFETECGSGQAIRIGARSAYQLSAIHAGGVLVTVRFLAGCSHRSSPGNAPTPLYARNGPPGRAEPLPGIDPCAIMKEIPDIGFIHIWTNDSGAGFEFVTSLYAGRNGGPYLLREWKSDEEIAQGAGKNVITYYRLAARGSSRRQS